MLPEEQEFMVIEASLKMENKLYAGEVIGSLLDHLKLCDEKHEQFTELFQKIVPIGILDDKELFHVNFIGPSIFKHKLEQNAEDFLYDYQTALHTSAIIDAWLDDLDRLPAIAVKSSNIDKISFMTGDELNKSKLVGPVYTDRLKIKSLNL